MGSFPESYTPLLLPVLSRGSLSPLWWWWIWGNFLPHIHALNLKLAGPLLCFFFRPQGEDGVLNVSLFPYSLLLPVSRCSHLPVEKDRAIQMHASYFQSPRFSRRSMSPLWVNCLSVLAPCRPGEKKEGRKTSCTLFSSAIYPCGKTGMSRLHTFHTLYSQFSFPLYWLGWAGLYVEVDPWKEIE